MYSISNNRQPTQCTIPLISTMPVVGLEALVDAIGKIIDDLAKRFFNSYARNAQRRQEKIIIVVSHL
jgi:hypothetical protein